MPHTDEENSKKQKDRLVRLASYFSVATALFIVSIKTYGWINTNSVAIMTSLLDSVLDISSSLINMIAIRIALIPADDNHRFGHHKIQDLAIFTQSSFFIFSGLFAIFSSIKQIFVNHQVYNYNEGFIVIILSILTNIALIQYQNYVIKKTNSKIIEVDKLHYVIDLITNLSVIVSLYITQYIWYIDILFGIAIGSYITFNAIKILRESIRNLTDEELSNEKKEEIIQIISQHTKVKGIHEFKTRYAGDKSFVQFHLELDPNITLLAAHDISDDIMYKIQTKIKNCEVLIHQDPAGYEKNVQFNVDLTKK